MRWGTILFIVQASHLLTGSSRMGKTIQIISLFVSDGAKPNLVVAYVNRAYIFYNMTDLSEL